MLRNELGVSVFKNFLFFKGFTLKSTTLSIYTNQFTSIFEKSIFIIKSLHGVGWYLLIALEIGNKYIDKIFYFNRVRNKIFKMLNDNLYDNIKSLYENIT